MRVDLSPEEETILQELTAYWGLPPEAAEKVKGTFAFHTALLTHRMKQVGREILAVFHHEHRN
jgi:hypothetical protein